MSKSRWKFAEKFKEWLGIKSHVENRNENILESQTDEIYDLILAVDIVTQIIVNLYDNAEVDYFTWIEKHLNRGGYVLFEICSFSKELEYIQTHNEPYSFWEEFPQEDPFQYGLYRCKIDSDNNIVWEKKFFEKKSKEFSEFKNVIKPYSEHDFLEIIGQYHMQGEIFHCYKEWGDLDEEGGYLVLAQKI